MNLSKFPALVRLLENGKSKFQRFGIRTKVAVTFAVLLLPAVAILGSSWFFQQRSLLDEAFDRQARMLLQDVCSISKRPLLLPTESDTGYQPLYKKVDDGSTVYILVFNDKKQLVSRNSKGPLSVDIEAPPSLESAERTYRRLAGVRVLERTELVRSKFGDQELTIGACRVGISLEVMQRAVLALWLKVGLLTLAILGAASWAVWSLSNIITAPLLVVVDAMKQVGKGNLQIAVPTASPDEIGVLTDEFNRMVSHLREKAMMEHYLSRGVLQRVKEMRLEDKIRLGGERRPVTIFFSDLRKSTALAEALPAEEVVRIFNIYMHLQTQVIHRAGGVVDKFLGDGVMAFFEGDDMELRAVRASFQIQRQFQTLNQFRRQLGLHYLEIGIGIHQGEAVLGNMGSEELMSYTAIGDTVNVAQRLCSIAEAEQVILSESIQSVCAAYLKSSPLPPLQLKGRMRPVQAFVLEDVAIVDDFERRMYPRRPVSLPLAYTLEEGEPPREGVLVNLGPGGLQMEIPRVLPPGTRLKVKVPGDKKFVLGPVELNGQVAWVQENPPRVGVVFEEMPERLPEKIALWAYTPETKEGEDVGRHPASPEVAESTELASPAAEPVQLPQGRPTEEIPAPPPVPPPTREQVTEETSSS